MSYGALMAVTRSRDNQPEGNTRRYEREPVRNEYDRVQNREYNRPRSMEPRYEGRNNSPMDVYGEEDEMIFRDRRGRRHYENGRFAPVRAEIDDEYGAERSPERSMGFIRGGEQPRSGGYPDSYMDPQRMNSRGMGPTPVPVPMPVHENKGSGWVVQGQFGGERHNRESDRPMDEAMANEWTRRMRGDDGSTGPHWSMEQVRQLQQQRQELSGHDLPEVFAVMNMMYSDYSKVAKKFGVNNMDFYVCLAKAWIDDPDAGKDKTARYYERVVK